MAECKHTGERAAGVNSPNDDKQFTCSICIGNYRNPRYLPTCGHTFCENCLFKHARNIQQETQGSKFECSVCRKPNKLPEHDEVTLQWVQTFPLNTVIVKMMEALPHSSEEMKEERICDPCKDEGEINAGLKFCLDCKEVLCKACTKCHKKFKVSKDHKLIDVKEISVEATCTDFFTGVGKCVIHPDRDVEIYCKTHDAVIYFLCSSFQHNTCEISEISGNDIDEAKLQKDSELLISQMKAATEHLEHLQGLRMEIKNSFKQKLMGIQVEVEQVRDQVVELVDNIVNHVKTVAKQIELEREDGIEVEISKIAQIKKQTEQNVATLDTIGQHGSAKHKFVSAHLMKRQFEEIGKQIDEEDKRLKQLDAELVIAENLKKLIESTNVEKLVEIKVTESKSSHTPLASVSTLQRDTAESESSHTPLASVSTQPRDMGVVANVLRDSNLVMVEEHTVRPYVNRPYVNREPAFRGVSTCSDGRVILCDHNTSSDCRPPCIYNPANRTRRELNIRVRPIRAVQIDDNHLAAVIRGSKTITIVTVGNEPRVEKTLQTQYQPRSIVALNNGQLAVAWDKPPAFGVIDISGIEVIQKSYWDQDKNGRKFKLCQYLAVDEKRQHVIQPCITDKAVFCFDFTGKPVFTYSHPGLTDPQGVAVDKCGNIYVCEYTSPGSIHKLSPTGDPISVITEGVPSHPMAICSDVTGTCFWVTRGSGPRDKVAYFRLQ